MFDKAFDKKEIYKLKDYEIQILEMTEIYDYCEQKTEQTEKQNFNSIYKGFASKTLFKNTKFR